MAKVIYKSLPIKLNVLVAQMDMISFDSGEIFCLFLTVVILVLAFALKLIV